MKQVGATEARKDFFKLLDKVVEGETVVIKRKGVNLRLVREPQVKKKSKKIQYHRYIQGAVDQADQWNWVWSPSEGLKLKT